MSTPEERVREYLRQRKMMTRDLGQVIHVVHADPNAEMVELTIADLEEVLTIAEVSL